MGKIFLPATAFYCLLRDVLLWTSSSPRLIRGPAFPRIHCAFTFDERDGNRPPHRLLAGGIFPLDTLHRLPHRRHLVVELIAGLPIFSDKASRQEDRISRH